MFFKFLIDSALVTGIMTGECRECVCGEREGVYFPQVLPAAVDVEAAAVDVEAAAVDVEAAAVDMEAAAVDVAQDSGVSGRGHTISRTSGGQYSAI